MARDLNKVMLIGRLVADPELRAVPSGQSLVNFRVATSRQWTDPQGQQQSQTEFTQIVAWGKLADIANQYLRKGRQVFIEGRLQTRSWVDKQNQKRYRTEVVAENVIFLDSGARAAPASAMAPAFAEATAGRPAGEAPPAASAPRTASDDVPPPPSPESGEPAEPKQPAAVGTPKGEEKLEEIRIEDIPF